MYPKLPDIEIKAKSFYLAYIPFRKGATSFHNPPFVCGSIKISSHMHCIYEGSGPPQRRRAKNEYRISNKASGS